jgi:hypothetical protein
MKKEICVMCGKETPYDVTTIVHLRNYYIEGSGQLCKECYEDVYKQIIPGERSV